MDDVQLLEGARQRFLGPRHGEASNDLVIDLGAKLDRLVALDTLIALAMCGLAVWAAYSGDTTVVPGVVALALLSFVGSIAIARFRVRDDQT